MLEDQTRTFEKEMNQLSKTIHALQGGDAAQEGSSSTDYQVGVGVCVWCPARLAWSCSVPRLQGLSSTCACARSLGLGRGGL